jgi:hypothetical protein
VNNIKPLTASKKKKSASLNPFIQMIEDKRKIDEAIQEEKALSTLTDIKFVRPL